MWWYCGLYCRESASNCEFELFSHSNEQVTVSNPAEVAKTRLQLQGELTKGGGQKVYKNALDVFAKTWRNEGIRGLQRGLGAAVCLQRFFVVSFSYFTVHIPGKHSHSFYPSVSLILCQILLNGSRLGSYCLPWLLA